MKALIILLFIYINYQVSAKEEKYQLKVYPKKVKPGNIQFLNTGKYIKSQQPFKILRKQTSGLKDYTAFPVVPEKTGHLPNNEQAVNYFAEENVNFRSRVKKVLPDYAWSTRRRRSADPVNEEKKVEAEIHKTEEVSSVQVANITLETTTVKPTTKAPAKPVTTVKDNHKTNLTQAKPPLRSGGAKANPKAAKASKSNKRTQNKTTRRAGGKKNKKPSKSKKGGSPKSKASSKVRVSTKPKFASKLKAKATKGTRPGKSAAKGSRRLISGRDAVIEDFPYVVSIQKNDEHWCAGALLNPRLVVTTANCMWKANRVTRMEVRAGSRHVDRGGQLANIAEVMKHPGWGIRKEPDHDLALVLLDRNLKFSDKLHGVDLPNRAMMPAFDDAWITSWGAERRDGVFSPHPTSLQVYHTRLMDREKCNNVTKRFGVHVTENFICLAQTGKRAPCTRDTGAPAVSDGILWGLASWGIRKLCGTERFPAMFTYLASPSNMDFIMNATHFLMADERHYPYLDRYPFRAVTNPETQ